MNNHIFSMLPLDVENIVYFYAEFQDDIRRRQNRHYSRPPQGLSLKTPVLFVQHRGFFQNYILPDHLTCFHLHRSIYSSFSYINNVCLVFHFLVSNLIFMVLLVSLRVAFCDGYLWLRLQLLPLRICPVRSKVPYRLRRR